MRLKEFLNEWSNTSKNVIQYLQDKGYKLLGQGVDQSAFEEPNTGKVLKIFGSKKFKTIKANPGHIMFEVWHEYCTKNKSNPFLPKFNGWTYFDFEDQTYMQIRMERLIPVESGIANALEMLANNFERIPNNKFDEVVEFILNQIGKDISDKMRYDIDAKINDDDPPILLKLDFSIAAYALDELNQLMIMIGKNKFVQLLRTIKEVAELSKKKGYQFDLHAGNFMHRNDGIPVIVDPWVVDSYRSVGKMSRGYK